MPNAAAVITTATKNPALVSRLVELLRSASAQLSFDSEQIEQMAPMFPGDDQVQEAMEGSNELATAIDALLAQFDDGPAEMITLSRSEYTGVVRLLASGQELMDDAITTHIYCSNDDIPPDCSYHSFVADAKAMITRLPSAH